MPRSGSGKVILRIESGIAQELESAPMEPVRPGFSDYVDLTAAVISVSRVEVVGDDAKFRNRVEVGNDGGAVVPALFHVRTVDHETVGRLALSVHGLVTGVQAPIHRTVADARGS